MLRAVRRTLVASQESRPFDVLDVINSGSQSSFECTVDAAFYLLGVQAGVLPCDVNHRDIDVGEDACARTLDYHRTHQENQQHRHDKRAGPIQSYANNPHKNLSRQSALRVRRSLLSSRWEPIWYFIYLLEIERHLPLNPHNSRKRILVYPRRIGCADSIRSALSRRQRIVRYR